MLVSSLAQGMKCLITYTKSTAGEDFYGEGADAKVPELGARRVTLDSIFGPIKAMGDAADLLTGIKDPKPAPAQGLWSSHRIPGRS